MCSLVDIGYVLVSILFVEGFFSPIRGIIREWRRKDSGEEE